MADTMVEQLAGSKAARLVVLKGPMKAALMVVRTVAPMVWLMVGRWVD